MLGPDNNNDVTVTIYSNFFSKFLIDLILAQ